MRVLIGCERSGVIREAFRARGHNTWSCDLEEALDGSEFHYRVDVLRVLGWGVWDLFIVHPPCTYLSSSGLHWNARRDGRAAKTEHALQFVRDCLRAPIKRICLENPMGCINTRIPWAPRPQYIQPYEFGDDGSKKTGLWLIGLKPLIATGRVPGRQVLHENVIDLFGPRPKAERFANQTDSGQNRLGPSPTRAFDRARTYPGVAAAMAAQWG